MAFNAVKADEQQSKCDAGKSEFAGSPVCSCTVVCQVSLDDSGDNASAKETDWQPLGLQAIDKQCQAEDGYNPQRPFSNLRGGRKSTLKLLPHPAGKQEDGQSFTLSQADDDPNPEMSAGC